MKKIITLNESQLINLINKWVSNHIINEGRKKIHEDGLNHLYKITFGDGSTYYSQSKLPTIERFKNFIKLTYQNKNNGEISEKLNQSPGFDVDLILKSKNQIEISNAKKFYIKKDINSINLRKSGFKNSSKIDTIKVEKQYTITDKDNNIYISSILVNRDPNIKSRVTTKNSLNVNGSTYYKVNNPNKINLVGGKSASLIKPKKVEDDSEGVTLTSQQLSDYLQSLRKEPDIIDIESPDELISNEPSIKKLKDAKKYKYGVNPNMSAEQILDWVIFKGYETIDDMKNDFSGGGKYIYNNMGLEKRKQITDLLGKSTKEKRTNKTKKNIVKSRDRYNYYSTSTNPNINLKYSVEESVRKILKTII
jgi:hypothetical protein